jgi:hypothetical protein
LNSNNITSLTGLCLPNYKKKTSPTLHLPK